MKRRRMMDCNILVKCRISKGIFRDEWLVKIEEYNKSYWTAFADKKLVRFNRQTETFYLCGYLIHSGRKKILVEFPVEEATRRIYVASENILRYF